MLNAVVRCPFCVRADGFMPMYANGGDRYVCPKCGHIVMASGSATFRCSCRHCEAMDAYFPRKLRKSWSAPA